MLAFRYEWEVSITHLVGDFRGVSLLAGQIFRVLVPIWAGSLGYRHEACFFPDGLLLWMSVIGESFCTTIRGFSMSLRTGSFRKLSTTNGFIRPLVCTRGELLSVSDTFKSCRRASNSIGKVFFLFISLRAGSSGYWHESGLLLFDDFSSGICDVDSEQ